MKRCENVLQAIGRTPIVRLNRVVAGISAAVYAKIEFVNPGGSVKDRVAQAMIEKAEQEGALKPGGTIIEATAGNTGAALAMAAAVKGYRCIFVMPDKMSLEKVRLLQAYGAEVIMTPASAESNSPEGYGGVASRLLTEIPNSWQPNQFTNLSNPDAHYLTTGPEIWEQTEGKVTAFVAGVGTGGTISGVGRYLKERNPRVKIVAGDPEGSVLSGGNLAPWAVEGIGEDYVPKTLNAQLVDEWIRVSDADSFHVARDLAKKEGLLVGGSSGTAVAAALRYARRLGPNDLVVALCPDTGRNYLSKMYSDDWMIERGFMDRTKQPATVEDILKWRPGGDLIHVRPDDPSSKAVVLLHNHGISQMPVLDEHGVVVGAIREITLARLLHSQKDPRLVPVREIMARALPEVSPSTDVDEVYRLLMAGNSGVIVTAGGKASAIVTRMDLVDFWDSRAGALEAGAAAR